jgi:transcriptional regulator with XRE-family HTH domain
MCENICVLPIGPQIRRLREDKGWSLAALAARAGTSTSALHRYEGGWERFELATLRRIAAALGARLEIRLVAPVPEWETGLDRSPEALARLLTPLFWDKPLSASDLDRHPQWALKRVLMFGNRQQVAAARRHFGDEAVRQAVGSRQVDAKTRNYWQILLGEAVHASEGPE